MTSDQLTRWDVGKNGTGYALVLQEDGAFYSLFHLNNIILCLAQSSSLETIILN